MGVLVGDMVLHTWKPNMFSKSDSSGPLCDRERAIPNDLEPPMCGFGLGMVAHWGCTKLGLC